MIFAIVSLMMDSYKRNSADIESMSSTTVMIVKIVNIMIIIWGLVGQQKLMVKKDHNVYCV